MMHDLSDDRINQINKWLMCIKTISTEYISFEDKNDPFTKWDKDSYHVVVYNSGEIRRDLISSDRPSVKLHKINSIMNGWGLEFHLRNGWNEGRFHWKGETYVTMEMNTFHRNLFKFDEPGGRNDWFEYTDSYIKEQIDEHIIDKAIKSGNIPLMREVKIRSILGK